jgi:acylphosphatase
VQGVGYRANTRRIANRLGLKGYVRNLRDGSVEIHAEGDDEMIERLIQWCYRGPTGAVVKKVLIEKTESTGDYKDFLIKRTF